MVANKSGIVKYKGIIRIRPKMFNMNANKGKMTSNKRNIYTPPKHEKYNFYLLYRRTSKFGMHLRFYLYFYAIFYHDRSVNFL